MVLRSVILVATLLAACRDREVVEIEKVKRAVCTCKTSACAETAMKDLPKGDVKANHREQVIARDILDCLAKLYAAERPEPEGSGSN